MHEVFVETTQRLHHKGITDNITSRLREALQEGHQMAQSSLTIIYQAQGEEDQS